MKALALLTAAALTLLSVAGCAQYTGYYGKGKSPAASCYQRLGASKLRGPASRSLSFWDTLISLSGM